MSEMENKAYKLNHQNGHQPESTAYLFWFCIPEWRSKNEVESGIRGRGKLERARRRGKLECARGRGKLERAKGRGNLEHARGRGKLRAVMITFLSQVQGQKI